MRFSIILGLLVLNVLLAVGLFSCSGGGGGGGNGENVGWVTITEPTTSDTYTATDVTTINLAGETFLSSAAETKEGTGCTGYGWYCFLNPESCGCETYTYYDSGVTVTVTNETTGNTAQDRLASRDWFITHWSVDIPLAPNENVIQVRAAGDLGNWGTDQITIYAVDGTPPTVLSTIPENISVASVASAITVIFSEAMDTSTITTSSFTVSDGVSNISSTISFSEEDTVATFTPSANLSYNTTYTVTLNGTIQDLAGNTLTATSWSFTTVLEPTPLNVQATAGDGQVTISWDALPGADYYNIYFDTSPDVTTSSGTLISGITSTSYTHTGLTNGDWYYYIVTAVNVDGESPASSVASAMAGLVVIKQSGMRNSGIAVDANGNSYVTGSSRDGDAGYHDVFIAKYDTSNNPLWIRQFGTTAIQDIGIGITVDVNGNSYVTGYTKGDLAGSGNAGCSDVFIAKYDTSGNQLWIRQFGTANYEWCYGIAVDANGNSYVTGSTAGDLAGTGHLGNYDVFIAKYDTSGNQLWIKQFGTTIDERGNGIAVDANGNSYVTGSTASDLAGTGHLGNYDVFIAKYDTSGNPLWIKQFGTTSEDRGNGIAVDANGSSYITGSTQGDLAGSGYAGNYDLFIVKLDTSGNPLWIKQFGTTSEDRGNGIAVDANGNSYVTGSTAGDLAGTGHLGFDDVFIAKLDTSGNPLWIKQFGTTIGDRGNSIAVDSAGNSYVTGDGFIAHLYP